MQFLGRFEFNGKEYLPVDIETVGTVIITREALQSRIIVDNLLADGWQLTGINPTVFTKGDQSTANIAPCDPYPIDEDTLETLGRILEDKYDDVSFRALVAGGAANAISHHNFRRGTDYIKTKEDFLRFLDGEKVVSSNENIYNVLPYAAFVAQSALPTIDEYYSSAFVGYRHIMEKHSNMTLKGYKLLVRVFKEMGILKDGYTMVDFMDCYFSFGFNWNSESVISIKKSETTTILGQSMKDGVKLCDRTFGVLDQFGQVHKEAGYEGYENAFDQSAMQVFLRELNNLGPGYVKPVPIEGRFTTTQVDVLADNYSVSYIPSQMFVSYNGQKYFSNTIRVYISTHGQEISFGNLCLDDATCRSRIFDNIAATALTTALLKRATVNFTGSSFTALIASGKGVLSSLASFTQDDVVGEEIATRLGAVSFTGKSEENKKAKISQINVYNTIKSFLAGDISDGTPEYLEISSVIDDIVTGAYHTGMIAEGFVYDSAIKTDEYDRAFLCAMRFMGYSLKQLIDIVSNIQPGQRVVELAGNNMKLAIKLSARDNAYKAYKGTLYKEEIKASKEARALHFIIGVTRECCGLPYEKTALHESVICQTIERDSGIDMIRKRIEHQFMERVEKHLGNSATAVRYKELIAHHSAEALFALAANGFINFPEKLGGGRMDISDKDVRKVQLACHMTTESLVSLDMYAANNEGSYQNYFINGTILPFCVVPKERYTLSEVPFYPSWRDETKAFLGAKENPALLNNLRTWQAKELCPKDPNFKGFKAKYEKIITDDKAQTTSINLHPYDPINNPITLTYYENMCNEYFKTLPLDIEYPPAPRHCEAVYPYFFTEDGPFSYLLTRDPKEYPRVAPGTTDPKELARLKKPQTWCCRGEKALITRQDIFDRLPGVKQLFQPEIKDDDAKDIELFSAVRMEDLVYANDLEDINFSPTFGDRIRLLGVFANKYLVFMDDSFKHYSCQDIVHLDKSKYAIEQFVGRSFLIEDIHGRTWRVTV